MRAVNLLPREDARALRQRHVPNLALLVAVLSAVVLTALLSGWFLVASSNVTQKHEELDVARAELAATPPPPVQPQTNDGLRQEKDQRLTALSTALSGRLAWDRVLRELSLVLPEDIWLSSLQAKSPAMTVATPGVVAPTTGGFTLTGHTYSHDGVARLLGRLELVPHLTGVQLQSSTLTELSGRPVVEFTILAGVRQPGATS